MKTAWLACVVGLMACGGHDSVGTDGSVETLGEACTILGEAACLRVSECHLLGSGETVAACESSFVTSCCVTPGTCGRTSMNPTAAAASITKCTNDLDNWDCSALSRALLPPTCLAPQ